MLTINGKTLDPGEGIIYISGPMTGIEDFNRKEFNGVAIWLRNEGFTVVNPAALDLGQDASYEDYLIQDLKMMLDCKTLVVLPRWEKSKGAYLEVFTAWWLKKEIVFLPWNWSKQAYGV